MALTLSAMFRIFVELQITSNPEFSLPLLCLDMSCWLCRQQSHPMTENMILVLLFRQRWGCNHCWLHALRGCRWSRSEARMQKLELRIQAVGLSVAWDQRGGSRELLVDSAATAFFVCLSGQQCQVCQFFLSTWSYFLSKESLFRTAPREWWFSGKLDFHTHLASCHGEQSIGSKCYITIISVDVSRYWRRQSAIAVRYDF